MPTNEGVYISNYSGAQIDEGIATIPQLAQRITEIERDIAGEGDAGLGVTVGSLDTRITNNSNAILQIKNELLPTKVNISDYNNRVGGAETQIYNLNTSIGQLEGTVGLKASNANLNEARASLQSSINRVESAYKEADKSLVDKIDGIEDSLSAIVDDLSLTVSGHSTKISEMENKVNSAPTDANFASINDKVALLETNKVDKSQLEEINYNISRNANQIDTNKDDISNIKVNINSLTMNKLDANLFQDLNNRVAMLEEDTTTEGLTTQLEELQKSINDILAEMEVIKSRLSTLENTSTAT